MGDEDRTAAFEESLQLRVLRVRNQGLVEDTDDGLVIPDFVIDVGHVECSAVQGLHFRAFGFFRRQFPVIDVDCVGDEDDLSDLGVIGWRSCFGLDRSEGGQDGRRRPPSCGRCR